MSFKVHVLGSGSRGNAILLETSRARLLVDAGLSGRQLARRMTAVDVEPDSLTAIVVTHEHRDHCRGLGVFARRWGTPIYLTQPTARSCADLLSGDEDLRFYRTGEPLQLEDLAVEPFLTCHDAVDPVAVTIRQTTTELKVGVATDLGTPTVAVRHALRGSHLLILEANHDDIMLREGPYPWSIKSRIAGRHGHLSNRSSAELGVELMHRELAGVVLAHLSQECNEPELAAGVVGRALERKGYGGPMWVASQDEPLAGLDLSALLDAVRPPQLELL